MKLERVPSNSDPRGCCFSIGRATCYVTSAQRSRNFRDRISRLLSGTFPRQGYKKPARSYSRSRQNEAITSVHGVETRYLPRLEPSGIPDPFASTSVQRRHGSISSSHSSFSLERAFLFSACFSNRASDPSIQRNRIHTVPRISLP